MSFQLWRQTFDPIADREALRLAESLTEQSISHRIPSLIDALRDGVLKRLDEPLPPSIAEAHHWAIAKETATDEAAFAAQDEGDDAAYSKRFSAARKFGALRELTTPDVPAETVLANGLHELYYAFEGQPGHFFEFLRGIGSAWVELANEAQRA